MKFEQLQDAVEQVALLSPRFHWVGIYLLKNEMLELGPYKGENTEHTLIPVGRGVCGTAVLEGSDQNVPDVRKHSNYLACSLKTRSELVVLIRDRNQKIVAQIDIDSHEVNAFGPNEEKAVQKIAQALGEVWNA